MIDKDRIRARLMARISRDPATGCWIYLRNWTDDGEAMMRVGSKVYKIRRVTAWIFKDVELWEDVYVYRICQSPACCNPRHCRVADSFQTVLKDMRRRGLIARPGWVRLSPMRRRCIRAKLLRGVPARAIAQEQKLNATTVRRCLR